MNQHTHGTRLDRWRVPCSDTSLTRLPFSYITHGALRPEEQDTRARARLGAASSTYWRRRTRELRLWTDLIKREERLSFGHRRNNESDFRCVRKCHRRFNSGGAFHNSIGNNNWLPFTFPPHNQPSIYIQKLTFSRCTGSQSIRSCLSQWELF